MRSSHTASMRPSWARRSLWGPCPPAASTGSCGTSRAPLHRASTASTQPLRRLCAASAPPMHRPCTASAPPLHRLCAASAPPLHHPPPLHRSIASSAALPLCRCVARGTDGAVMSGAGAGADARGGADIEANRRLVARFCAGGAALLAAQGELHITHKVAARRALGWRWRYGGEVTTLTLTASLSRWGCSSGTSSSRGCNRSSRSPPRRRQLARARQARSSMLARWRLTGRRILRTGHARCAQGTHAPGPPVAPILTPAPDA